MAAVAGNLNNPKKINLDIKKQLKFSRFLRAKINLQINLQINL